MRSGIAASLWTSAAALVLPQFHARADEVRVLSAASMQTVFKDVVPEFEHSSGHKLSLRYGTMGAITERVAHGERADLVISSPDSIAALVAFGRIDAASQSLLAKTGVGAVVPVGNSKPRIDSAEDFRRALRAARFVVYANPARGGAAGIHIAHLIQRLRMTKELKPKTRLAAGGDVTEVTLALGDGALGLTQVSEIVGKAGADYVPIGTALQNYTGFVAGTPAGEKRSEAVRAFIEYLKTPRTLAVMKSKGMLPEEN